ncbi:MAG: hypothetical protein K6G30_13130 [Acetatifactor sp.]|jgi:hypothetical protein|nr:hypothetical protein [Acetatifactor sp.]
MNQGNDVKHIFQEFSRSFQQKITTDFYISLEYDIVGESETTIVQIQVKDGKIQLFYDTEISVEDTLVMSYATLKKLYTHELTMMTAMSCLSKESGYTKRFIEPKYIDETRILYLNKKNAEEAVSFAHRLHIMDEFFNIENFHFAKVDSMLCGKAHGVNVIGLYSDFEKGIKHAYFEINQGEVLREPPIPFSLYVLQGKGIIFTDNKKIEIEEKTYYHIEPSGEVQITSNDSVVLQLLYLGRG